MQPDVDRICPLPPDPSRPPRIISRATALAHGYTRGAIEHRLASGQWRRVLPRAYFTADTFTEHDRTAAALTFAGPGAALSGAAALRASGVRRVAPREQVLVVVPERNRTRSAGFVVVRRSLPDRTIRAVDFYGPRLRACLEIDSVEWHYGVDEWAGTWDRHLDLTKYGYSVIHRPPSALREPARFTRDVTDRLTGREAELRRGLR